MLNLKTLRNEAARGLVAVLCLLLLSACGGGGDDVCAGGRPLYGDLQREYDAQCPNRPEDAGK